MAKIPKASGGDRKSQIFKNDSGVHFETKTEVIEKAGFTPKQVQRFETLAKNRDAGAKKVNAYKKKKALFFYRQNSTNSGIAANSIKLNVIEIVSKSSRFMRLLGIKSSINFNERLF